MRTLAGTAVTLMILSTFLRTHSLYLISIYSVRQLKEASCAVHSWSATNPDALILLQQGGFHINPSEIFRRRSVPLQPGTSHTRLGGIPYHSSPNHIRTCKNLAILEPKCYFESRRSYTIQSGEWCQPESVSSLVMVCLWPLFTCCDFNFFQQHPFRWLPSAATNIMSVGGRPVNRFVACGYEFLSLPPTYIVVVL